ncbi:hypothetical protein [Bacillus cereus]|uniref:hypothetical protein n=1 Tax=Bacillus cereus TaxID=1396 RepID=UPI001681629B|nr:hypothetical protein [Bacillus cereus]
MKKNIHECKQKKINDKNKKYDIERWATYDTGGGSDDGDSDDNDRSYPGDR